MKEDKSIRIKKAKQLVSSDRPDLPRWLFWDVRYDNMDFRECYLFVIVRVMDRGNNDELAEVIRFYGRDKVLHVLCKEPIYLLDRSLQRVCAYFGLQPEDTHCYHRKKARGGHWF
jgi:hypothetical protein